MIIILIVMIMINRYAKIINKIYIKLILPNEKDILHQDICEIIC